MSHLNRYKEILERDGPLFMKTLPKNPLEAIKKYPAAFTFSLLVAFIGMTIVYLLFGGSSVDKKKPVNETDEKPDVPEDDDDKTVHNDAGDNE